MATNAADAPPPVRPVTVFDLDGTCCAATPPPIHPSADLAQPAAFLLCASVLGPFFFVLFARRYAITVLLLCGGGRAVSVPVLIAQTGPVAERVQVREMDDDQGSGCYGAYGGHLRPPAVHAGVAKGQLPVGPAEDAGE